MASLCSQPQSVFSSLAIALLLIVSLSPTLHSQAPPVTSEPTITECTSTLLPLTPCAPFVQGISRRPVQSCCDNLSGVYLQQPGCLCLLLNNSSLSPFPINTALAKELPAFCNIDMDSSTCSGIPQTPGVPPASQVSPGGRANASIGKHVNSSVAAPPVVQVSPRPGVIGFSFGRSNGGKLKADGPLTLLVTLAVMTFSNLALIYDIAVAVSE